MKTRHETWSISELIERIDRIEYPEFQREPSVWNMDKKRRLIDSIMRGFDISAIYLSERDRGFDCIDGRQRLNALSAFIGLNEDSEDNKFHLRITNEIYDDGNRFADIQDLRYQDFPGDWLIQFNSFKMNVVIISEVDNDEELNLLFLRLQIASVLNAGEKLHAMIGSMRDAIFGRIVEHAYFQGIRIQNRRYAKEQVAGQIVANVFSRDRRGEYRRVRFNDLQEFLKEYSGKLTEEDEALLDRIMGNLDFVAALFGDRLAEIRNRALAVTVYQVVSDYHEANRDEEVKEFPAFYSQLIERLKWQVPKGVNMSPHYHDLLKLQYNITQAAVEKPAIQKRGDFVRAYFEYYRSHKCIRGDVEYQAAGGVIGQDTSK